MPSHSNIKRDEPGKTRKFIKKGLILWVIVVGIFLFLKVVIANWGDLSMENSSSGYIDQLSGIILVSGIGGIPLILFLSVVLKLAENAIDKLGND